MTEEIPGRPTSVGPPAEETPRTPVPTELVGSWDGDYSTLSFSGDGRVTFAFKNSSASTGTVAIELRPGRRLTTATGPAGSTTSPARRIPVVHGNEPRM